MHGINVSPIVTVALFNPETPSTYRILKGVLMTFGRCLCASTYALENIVSEIRNGCDPHHAVCCVIVDNYCPSLHHLLNH